MPNTPDAVKRFKRIGVVGAGNMGSMMAFAFSEIGLDVSIWDVNSETVDTFAKQLQQAKGMKGKSTPSTTLTNSPAAWTIKQYLKRGDIILDGGNEHYRNTERRQKECEEIGVSSIGIGVSGGYQPARHGPSMSPGGDPDALDRVIPLLELYAAKDPKTGMPCVMNMGPRGAGHYVKMIHNDVEVGMMSAVCEAWSFLSSGLGLSYNKIGDIFAKWNDCGEMRTTYLLELAEDICRTTKSSQGDRKGEGASNVGGYVLDDILDKVVQDDDTSEGTPTWSIMGSA
ncbi:unnamed protein product [Penicillium nalgiovense]|nr:unnamed protein product [Penicillium nalgiovense]